MMPKTRRAMVGSAMAIFGQFSRVRLGGRMEEGRQEKEWVEKE